MTQKYWLRVSLVLRLYLLSYNLKNGRINHMKKYVLKAIWLASIFICTLPALAAEYIIHAGRLIDGVSDRAKESVSVVVLNNEITAIKSGYLLPNKRQQVIDLKDSTIMPGLIDLHTHIDVQVTQESYTEGFFKNPADFALRATQYTKATLQAGFTTVRNLGGEVSMALRNAINAGYIEGPRIFAAGKAIATTGGHADPSNSINQKISQLMGDPGPKEGVISGPYEARRAVRQRYKEGSDVIKLTVTGGVLSLAKSGDNTQFMSDELDAIMQTAHDYSFIVAVHAHGAEGMKRAVEAGVDTVEHGTYMTDEIMELMKKKGTYYVPTISAGNWVAEKADTYPDIIQPKAKAVGPQIQKTFAKAYKQGVKIAFGSDAGVFPHGMNGKEFIYMVEAGMPAMEAIQSATITAAKVLHIDNRLGSVEKGKIADIVAVKGNPLVDIEVMTNVNFVMKEGKIFKLRMDK